MIDIIWFYLYAIGLGVALAVPLGPSGLFIMNNSISGGLGAGMKSIAGLVVAEIVYVAIAFIGYEYFARNTASWEFYTGIVSAPIIIFIGSILLFQKQKDVISLKEIDKNVQNCFLKTFVLTMSNPTILIFYTGIISGLATLGREILVYEKIMFLFVFQIAGFLTILAMALFGIKMKEEINGKINIIKKAAGAMLSIYGMFMGVKLFL